MPIHIISREKETGERERAREGGRERKAKVTFKKLIQEDISEDLHLRFEKEDEEKFYAAMFEEGKSKREKVFHFG